MISGFRSVLLNCATCNIVCTQNAYDVGPAQHLRGNSPQSHVSYLANAEQRSSESLDREDKKFPEHVSEQSIGFSSVDRPKATITSAPDWMQLSFSPRQLMPRLLLSLRWYSVDPDPDPLSWVNGRASLCSFGSDHTILPAAISPSSSPLSPCPPFSSFSFFSHLRQ